MPELTLFGGLVTVRIQKGMLFGPWSALDTFFRSTLIYCGVHAELRAVLAAHDFDWRVVVGSLAAQRSREVWGELSSAAQVRGLAWHHAQAFTPRLEFLERRPQAPFSETAQAAMRQRAYAWAEESRSTESST